MILALYLIAIYQRLLELSQQMLRFAVEGEWDDLTKKEVDYVSAVQRLA